MVKLHTNGHTSVTEVIHQHYLCYQLRWRAVEDTVHCPEQGRPSFIVEWYYHTGVRELLQVQLILAAGHRQRKLKGSAKNHQHFHMNYHQVT